MSAGKLLFAVQTAVNAVFLIRQFEAVRQFLFYGSNAPWIFTFYDVSNHFRKRKRALFHDFIVARSEERRVGKECT